MNLKLLPYVLLFAYFQTGLAKQKSLREVLTLPELTTQHSILRGQAWTSSNDVIKTSLSSFTVGVRVKSSDLKRTGTLFSYYTSENELQFGLVSYRFGKESNPGTTEQSSDSAATSSGNDTNYELHVVVGNKVLSKPVEIRLDDAIWHYVCMTWSFSGSWQIYMDGELQDEGKYFQVGSRIPGYGRIFFGSTIKTDNSTEFAPFTGELTGLSVWDTVLPPVLIARVSLCNNYKSQRSPSWLFDYSKSTYDRLRTSLLYNWKTMGIVAKWPAKFQPIKKMCAREVTVDCYHDHMIISVSTRQFQSRNFNGLNLHLNDPSCRATARGQNRNRFVFDITDFQSCGTKRYVTDTEVIYTNHVSNSDKKYNVVFGNIVYNSEVRCYYPVDLTVSTKLIDQETDNKLIFRTPMVHPGTNTKDIEAAVMMFEDGSFSQAFTSFPQLRPNENLYVGFLVKNATTQTPVDDVNVVLDQCWVTSDNAQRQIIGRNGCWSDDKVTILENGKRSQGRLKLSSSLFALWRTPTYLECATHPCIGDSCTPSCGSNRTIPGFGEGKGSISWGTERHLSKRAVNPQIEDQRKLNYKIRVGPIFVKEFETTGNPEASYQATDDDKEFEASPVFIALVTVLSIVAMFCLLLAFALMRKKMLDSRRYDVTSFSDAPSGKCACGMNNERFTSFAPQQVSTLSSSMASSITSLSSFESEDLPQAESEAVPQPPTRNFYILV